MRLLPCPFCGSPAEKMHAYHGSDWAAKESHFPYTGEICCTNADCGLCLPDNRWNTRAHQPVSTAPAPEAAPVARTVVCAECEGEFTSPGTFEQHPCYLRFHPAAVPAGWRCECGWLNAQCTQCGKSVKFAFPQPTQEAADQRDALLPNVLRIVEAWRSGTQDATTAMGHLLTLVS